MSSDIEISLDLQSLLTPEQAWHYGIIPAHQSKDSLTLLTEEDKVSEPLREELELILGKKVLLKATSRDQIRRSLGKFYRKGDDLSKTKAVPSGHFSETEFLEKLVMEARGLQSSDIHLETYEGIGRVRFRIDGHLVERYELHPSDYPVLVNKIKIRANLDISEKRLPQDGRIHFQSRTAKFDIRVSSLPTLHGEKIVLRLLSNNASDIDIEKLGFSQKQLRDYRHGIDKPHGLVLISGPTGSGKTTTLYATLKILNKKTRNILTIEDPIEYTLEGINQVQLKENIGLDFPTALRTFLRQDPDVIMVGEIRDVETARMAIRAGLTGHLVLSTIHTNSAWGIVSRLIDMGIPSYLLSGILNLAIAQRLVRLLCEHCKREEVFDPSTLSFQPRTPTLPTVHFKACGCEHCHYSGYRGRCAVYEVIQIDEMFSEEIRKAAQDVGSLMQNKKIESLGMAAWEMFFTGKTSLEEVQPILMTH